MKQIILSLIILISGVSSWATDKVVYGDDNRQDLYEVQNPLFKTLARSTAAMIENGKLHYKGDIVKLYAQTLREYGVCAGERFTEQLTAANCSGFLVAEDILVTAGHCIKEYSDCGNYSWVFDFAENGEKSEIRELSANSIYRCVEVIKQELNTFSKNDYAIIKLDRKVTDREPLKFRTQGTIEVGTPLVVIGHPTGLPTKVADGAQVRTVKDIYFVSNLDTFGGNSGSAVFNAETGEVEGILVRGERDYKYNNIHSCYTPNYCTNDGCRGEDSTLITNLNLLNIISN